MKKATIVLMFIAGFVAACAPKATAIPESPSAPEVTSINPTETATVTFMPPTETSTAEPAPLLRISPSDGMTQLYVPAGNVNMGAFDIFAENDEKPSHAVQIAAFWMDQVEVTNGMYGLCVQTGLCRTLVKPNSDSRAKCFGNPEFQDYPVVYVTWLDAQTYCQWAGRRLPTEAEWERAARGDDMRTYPWGGEPPNDSLANFNNTVGDTSRVGSYTAGASPFGALDMAGNVWEWVADYYDQNYYSKSQALNPTGPGGEFQNFERAIRGGSYQDGLLDLRVSNRGFELGPDPAAIPGSAAYLGRSSVKIGFRCAEDD